jgi:hypothetical protein
MFTGTISLSAELIAPAKCPVYCRAKFDLPWPFRWGQIQTGNKCQNVQLFSVNKAREIPYAANIVIFAVKPGIWKLKKK